MSIESNEHIGLVRTGIEGLDLILDGGFPAHHLYLVQGNPGSGKTTLGLQFLLEGVRRRETVLYVGLSETKEELEVVAQSHGWDLSKVAIHELAPTEEALNPDSQYTMFQLSELELSDTTKAILDKVEALKPSRIVFDSLSELRLLAQNALRYRRQILALKQFFIGRRSTVLLLDDNTSSEKDIQLESIVHGVIELNQLAPEYGSERRRLRITKLRGRQYRGGFHDFKIVRGGMIVYPRLAALRADHRPSSLPPLSSSINELDALTGGGVDRGTSTLLMGPAGSGKSTLAMMYCVAAAEQGERAALFIFDESKEILTKRASSLHVNLNKHLESGMITITSINPGELSPGEFGSRICDAALGKDGQPPASVVAIDSLNGYLTAMPEERFLIIQLHELLTFLGHRGITTFMVVAQHGLVSEGSSSPVDTSYIADNVLLLRYFETAGEVRQAISVVKKRTGRHEKTIREFSIKGNQLHVGEPLREFQGVLSGAPRFCGGNSALVLKSE